jgi:hypothetical protein
MNHIVALNPIKDRLGAGPPKSQKGKNDFRFGEKYERRFYEQTAK